MSIVKINIRRVKLKPYQYRCFIIAKNEADRISKTISSVKDIVEEIIVIDSGSTDKTENL